MKVSARSEYGQQLRLRRQGIISDATGETPFNDVKPDFYADAHNLVAEVRSTYAGLREVYPPYGLINRQGKVYRTAAEASPLLAWLTLEGALGATVKRAFAETAPSLKACPYHPALDNLGAIALPSLGHDKTDIDRLRGVVLPGGVTAPALVVNLLRRLPAMATTHRVDEDVAQVALQSGRTLLHEPLQHPQQHAAPFMSTLARSAGDGMALDRQSFLSDELIAAYTTKTLNREGQTAIGWSRPTEDFTLLSPVLVANRLEGSEVDYKGEHMVLYPAGTRLGDIEVTEPTIGCPGSQLAYDIWQHATEVIVGEGLWQRPVA